MSTRRSRAPRDHVISGTWPHAHLDSDHAAAIAQGIAARLDGALAQGGISIRTISKTAGINRQTIMNVREGRVWATIAVIADLEQALRTDLWPRVAPISHGDSP